MGPILEAASLCDRLQQRPMATLLHRLGCALRPRIGARTSSEGNLGGFFGLRDRREWRRPIPDEPAFSDPPASFFSRDPVYLNQYSVVAGNQRRHRGHSPHRDKGHVLLQVDNFSAEHVEDDLRGVFRPGNQNVAAGPNLEEREGAPARAASRDTIKPEPDRIETLIAVKVDVGTIGGRLDELDGRRWWASRGTRKREQRGHHCRASGRVHELPMLYPRSSTSSFPGQRSRCLLRSLETHTGG